MKNLRVVLFVLFILFAMLAIAACGGEDPTPEPTATPQPQPTFTATALPAPTETATSAPIDTPVAAEASASAANSPLPEPAAINAAQAESPLATAAETICTTQMNIDLTSYPDIKNVPTVLGCPQSEASLDQVAINEFGSGPEYDRFMLWFGSEQQIYVLFPNQTWLAYSDNWNEGEPEITCNPGNGENTSPPLPRRGFGKLWCTVEDVQKEMGLIDREERLCQHSVTQRFDKGRLLACFEDATIRYFRILNDGRWDMVMVQ